jgi:hypothetical protein
MKNSFIFSVNGFVHLSALSTMEKLLYVQLASCDKAFISHATVSPDIVTEFFSLSYRENHRSKSPWVCFCSHRDLFLYVRVTLTV